MWAIPAALYAVCALTALKCMMNGSAPKTTPGNTKFIGLIQQTPNPNYER